MTQEQYESSANFWKNKERVEMQKEELKAKIDEYLQENNTCALATGTVFR